MARYDTGAIFDTGILYDATVGTLTADEAVVAGESSALPDRRIPWRDATATIWGFDPVAWLPTDQLANVAISATRSGTLTETGRQTETLAFDVAGAFTVPLTEGDWLCVQWSVEIPTDSTAFLGGVFRVSAQPSTDQDDAGTTYHCQATDWFSYLTQFSASASGWLRWEDLASFTTAYLGAGGTEIPDGEGDLATDIAAYLWHYTASGDFEFGHIAPFHVEPWSGFRSPYLATANPIAVQITTPGQPCRIADVLAWWWPLVAGYTLAYHADGGLLLSGRTPTDSGLYVTVDVTPLSSVPLPAEAAPQTLNPPQYTSVTYQQVFTPTDTIGVGGSFGDPTLLSGGAVAVYWSGVGERVERIIDTDHPVTLGGFESATAYCWWRLQEHLGGAQTIALTVDSCYPIPPLGRLVALQLVTGDIAGWPYAPGWWRITAFSQPLGNGPATWTLAWWGSYP